MKKPLIPIKNGSFSRILLKWDSAKNGRSMPWKGEKDPYRIWLSEIILQQTRVEQGTAYYNKFINKYPSVRDLANATDREVFKLWEGLGYYSRCRNLLFTARFIAKELKGIFPSDYDSIVKLKGIGPYTASAISSFAFDLPHAVVDGNVFRVLSRITGNETSIDSTAGKKYFTALANDWLDKQYPGRYNQAIMDHGATICKPVSPRCSICPFKKQCVAFLTNKVEQLPVKEKRTKIKKRWFYYFIVRHGRETAVLLRKGKDIWQGLYEFPMIEARGKASVKAVFEAGKKQKWFREPDVIKGTSKEFRQQLSHQLVSGKFITIELHTKPAIPGWEWVTKNKMKELPFPGLINSFLHV
jgi:A/G-specific adenine glycosylase